MTATNHAGWEVQELTKNGWINCIRCQNGDNGYIFLEKSQAEEFSKAIHKADGREYRVYESLK